MANDNSRSWSISTSLTSARINREVKGGIRIKIHYMQMRGDIKGIHKKGCLGEAARSERRGASSLVFIVKCICTGSSFSKNSAVYC